MSESSAGAKSSCSFCGQGEDDVAKMISGPSCCICSACITLSMDVLLVDTRQLEALERDLKDAKAIIDHGKPENAQLKARVRKLEASNKQWAHVGKTARENLEVSEARVAELESPDCERIAAIQHAIWSHWMRYLFSCSSEMEDGRVTIPADRVTRWKRQMETPYSELTAKEQASDLEQAEKVISALCDKSVEGGS